MLWYKFLLNISLLRQKRRTTHHSTLQQFSSEFQYWTCFWTIRIHYFLIYGAACLLQPSLHPCNFIDNHAFLFPALTFYVNWNINLLALPAPPLKILLVQEFFIFFIRIPLLFWNSLLSFEMQTRTLNCV